MPLDRLTDVQHAVVEVDVGPAQPGRLTWAQAETEHHYERGVQAVLCASYEELARFERPDTRIGP